MTDKCPCCGAMLIKCDICKEGFAEYEGWIRRGIMNARVRVCEKCIPKTLAGQKGKTAKDAT